MCASFLNSKGQFFSPDLIIAVFVFVLCLVFFFSAANFVFSTTDNLEFKSDLDEKSHTIMSSLIYSTGSPSVWETKELTDINFFGLVNENNVISVAKLQKLSDFLSTDYSETKRKLGLSLYDFKFDLVNNDGETIVSGGQIADEYVQSFNYERPVLYNGEFALFRVTLSYE